eukprot:jgi/Psemu1/249253/estExt_Genewise1Plus.C_30055
MNRKFNASTARTVRSKTEVSVLTRTNERTFSRREQETHSSLTFVYSSISSAFNSRRVGGRRRTKKLRGSRGSRVGSKEIFDLMVCVPKSPGQASASSIECKLLVKEVRDRLASTGFTHMALTHTIYGRPKPEDRADVAIPSSLWSTSEATPVNNQKTKKRKLNDSSTSGDGSETKITVLRRLHVVVENQSDMGVYLSNGPHQDLLNDYDLVSICPTNDITFQSACTTATMVDIITVDYSSRGLKLPYRIRSSDVKAATERGATFEIPLAPALLHLKQRKALVHACQDLRNGSMATKKTRIIVSSGDRTLDGSDAGALALRYPGDLSNLCKTVMRFDPATASHAVGSTAAHAVQRGKERRLGKTGIVGGVSLIKKNDLVLSKPVASRKNKKQTSDDKNQQKEIEVEEESNEDSDASEDDEHADDGYIAF